MIEAVYRGLSYGIIAGFSAVGFALTIFAIWAFIEGVTWVLGIHDKYFTSLGDKHGGGDSK